MHYLPHVPTSQYGADILGAALWLEKRYWENMERAVANGISLALGGES